jgi:hypothetical protein
MENRIFDEKNLKRYIVEVLDKLDGRDAGWLSDKGIISDELLNRLVEDMFLDVFQGFVKKMVENEIRMGFV